MTGQFGAPIGGANLINAAMQAQGAQGSPLGQISPTAPGFNPALASQPPIPMGQGAPSPIPQGMPQPPMPQQAPQAPIQQAEQALQNPQDNIFNNPQEKIIVQALIKQLERIDKTKQMTLGGGAGVSY